MHEERVLLESDTKEFVLTTHKVRLTARLFGQADVTSITLDELTSCEVKYISRPWLVILAAVAVISGFLFQNGEASGAGIGIAVILIAIYFATRYQAISLSSPSATINLSVKGMGLDKAIDLIDKVESAKHARLDGKQQRYTPYEA